MEDEIVRAFTFIIPGLSRGLVYALIALGFVLIFKCTGIFNLAVGEMMVFGGYLCYFFSVQLGVPLWGAVVLTVIGAGVVGLITNRLFIRPLIGQPVIAMVFITLALGSIIIGTIVLLWGSATLFVPRLFPAGGISILGSTLGWNYIGFGVVSLVLLIGLLAFFRYSRIGLSMMAISEDQQAAQALGVSVKRIVMVAWVIGITTAAIGGIMLTSLTSVQYGQATLGLIGIAVALVGGLQSMGGVIIGGLLVGLVQGLSAGYIDQYVPGSVQEVSAYIVMMLVLLLRPHGFFGWERIERV
ncbi:MAG: branched-chain amino acid ABC transporter permease [Chloroflexi bacterium]|nr:branched-chain amino acid ABC transporter permease [Chloroflexota bacterium]